VVIKHLLVSDCSEQEMNYIFTHVDFIFKYILFSLSFIGILNSMRILYSACLPTKSYAFSKSVSDVLAHHTTFLYPVSDRCRIEDQYFIYYVKIHTNDPQ
jgi:hypothetical protein